MVIIQLHLANCLNASVEFTCPGCGEYQIKDSFKVPRADESEFVDFEDDCPNCDAVFLGSIILDEARMNAEIHIDDPRLKDSDLIARTF